MSSNYPSDAMQQETLERVAQRYRDEGYQIVVRPFGEQIPPFIAGFQPDLIAIRGNEGVVVEIKVNRIDLSSDHQIACLAEIVNARPGWRLDLVVLEPETTIQKAAQEAAEPSDEQLAQILKTADELSEKGYSPYACVVAWGGLEAAMRRLQSDAELYGRTTPTELMRTLYGNGFLSREQFERLRESYKIRSQSRARARAGPGRSGSRSLCDHYRKVSCKRRRGVHDIKLKGDSAEEPEVLDCRLPSRRANRADRC